MPNAKAKPRTTTAEERRLLADKTGQGRWKFWGPYLAERAWGTVREDYSASGEAWEYFPHDHARSRAYRWNEDGLAGICDDYQNLCFGLSLWNGADPILKERLFGLTGREGNHGEDVKECYFYLDSTPTHTYMKMLYKYPQRAFPYDDLVQTNAQRAKIDPEYELIDTGVFDQSCYFDVFVEYAKAEPEDILIRITAANRGPRRAELHLLPTLWFRNQWDWGWPDDHLPRPSLKDVTPARAHDPKWIAADHAYLGRYLLACEGADSLLFTENETNTERLFGAPNSTPYVKDGINAFIVEGRAEAVNPLSVGTKVAAYYRLSVPAERSASIRLRLMKAPDGEKSLPSGIFASFNTIFSRRQKEADAFYTDLQPGSLTADERLVQRQAFAGMLWSKQFYHYNVEKWLRGDPSQPPPPPGREDGRNRAWRHLIAADIISMPDKWEYPWFAAWDLAFHCLPLALLDSEFAKKQLLLLGREWYQHANGQVPAYEWGFSDVNPPVLAWAAMRVYQIDKKKHGQGDRDFLERMFHKLLLNFTWWVNRKDADGNNVFQGGFLGLDNIGVFDRSAPLPTGGHIEQSDGTSWMGMFCLNMLAMSHELAIHDPVFEDIALKFFEHFLYIAYAMNNIAGESINLWNDDDEFFYDVLHLGPHENQPLKLRSMVGLIPLFATITIEPGYLADMPEFRHRMQWVLEHRPDLASLVSRWHVPGLGERRLLAMVRGHRMKRILNRMLDEDEFLSPYGVRALSRVYADRPYVLRVDGMKYSVSYQPAESQSEIFGGNSNWRGPVWFPVNFLIIESLQRFHHYYSDDFRVECPTGSGEFIPLNKIADELSSRLINIFLRDREGRRPVFGSNEIFQTDPHWRDYVPFYEYFHGDNGAGLGASHQTGWTGLVAKLIQQQGEYRK